MIDSCLFKAAQKGYIVVNQSLVRTYFISVITNWIRHKSIIPMESSHLM